MFRHGTIDHEAMPAYSVLTRRLGFEYNGMVLHEYYFGNLKRHAGGDAHRDAEFRAAAEESFRTVRAARFAEVLRGVSFTPER